MASGTARELWLQGHDILITELPVPLSVRRMVSFSRAVYDGHAEVEGVQAALADDLDEAFRLQKKRWIPVVVDPEAAIRKEYNPDVLIDGIMAKRNTGTHRTDAPFVVALGPGFTAGADCDCVIETMRGETLGNVIRNGSALPNTGVPGEIGGATAARLLRASASGTVEPAVSIGDSIKKGDVAAYTGGVPVYAQLSGVVRGLLQSGVDVQEGLKIGDVDPRDVREYCFTVSDKAVQIGRGACHAVDDYVRSLSI